MIRVNNIVKVKGFCRCNEGPQPVDCELIKREIIKGNKSLT